MLAEKSEAFDRNAGTGQIDFLERLRRLWDQGLW